MAKKLRALGSLDGSTSIYKKMLVGASQSIKAGDILVKSGQYVVKAASGPSANTIAGVAVEDITTDGTVNGDELIKVDINPNMTYTMNYTGSTKTSVDNKDLGKQFDLGSDAQTINLDDTTGGFLECIGYNNDEKTMNVIIRSRVY